MCDLGDIGAKSLGLRYTNNPLQLIERHRCWVHFMMDAPVVVDSVRSLLEVIRSIVRIVWQDIREERANKVVISHSESPAIVKSEPSPVVTRKTPREGNPFKYHPAEW